MTLRAVVFFSTSTAGLARGALASWIHPFFCVIPFLVYWTMISGFGFVQVLPFLILAPILSFASANLLVSLIDRLGRKSYGIPAMSLFRAFMLNWVVGLNAPIEQYFEKMGEDEDVEVSFLKFETAQTKAAIIVPLVHPGPFKNIGSSLLPSLLKHEFEKSVGGAVSVPLGILGHELDLASQAQNQKIISTVIASARNVFFSETAKPFVKSVEGHVTVSCQVFGDAALLSFTLSPKTTEDLPQELGRFVREEARNCGLKDAIVVNAHNSITETTDLEESLDTLKAVASKCLKKAVSPESKLFQVGAATVYPREFSLEDGMGSGGITVTVVKVAEQKTAYVVIDGNNMISGLREKLLSALKSIGFDESEVFTTDTHAVNAVVLGRRGYHPIGESMDHDALIGYIKEAASSAVERLETCKVGFLTITVPKVRVIGQSRIHALSTLVDKALQKAKRIVVPIFALEGVLLILLLAVL
jgi:putative membrane protein